MHVAAAQSYLAMSAPFVTNRFMLTLEYTFLESVNEENLLQKKKLQVSFFFNNITGFLVNELLELQYIFSILQVFSHGKIPKNTL